MDLQKRDHVYFIGIGGTGMSPIAYILLKMGYTVSGSDLKENVYTLQLKNEGATIYYGHHESNIRIAKYVVISSAIHDDNIELIAARNAAKFILKRAEMLSWIMDQHSRKIAVSGTHGKTTTSAMLATAFTIALFKPTYIIGGTISAYQKNSDLGDMQYAIAEADESDRSFLYLNPSVLIITNIEEDHMDNFKDLREILDVFKAFTKKVPESGCLVVCGDDSNALMVMKNYSFITYGLNKENLITGRNIKEYQEGSSYDLVIKNQVVQSVQLSVPGLYNIKNSLAVFAVALFYNLPLDLIAKGLETFKGTHRRLQRVGQYKNSVIYDDYAHHPTEVKTTLQGVRRSWPDKNIVVIFQPHRYSRLNHLMNNFSLSFGDADTVIITDVFSAGEHPIEGATSEHLVALIHAAFPGKALYLPKPSDVSSYLLKQGADNTFFLTMGAGDITYLAKELFNLFKVHNL